MYLFIYVFIYVFICVFIYVFIYLRIYLCMYLFMYYLFMYLFMYLFIYVFIYIFSSFSVTKIIILQIGICNLWGAISNTRRGAYSRVVSKSSDSSSSRASHTKSKRF